MLVPRRYLNVLHLGLTTCAADQLASAASQVENAGNGEPNNACNNTTLLLGKKSYPNLKNELKKIIEKKRLLNPKPKASNSNFIESLFGFKLEDYSTKNMKTEVNELSIQVFDILNSFLEMFKELIEHINKLKLDDDSDDIEVKNKLIEYLENYVKLLSYAKIFCF